MSKNKFTLKTNDIMKYRNQLYGICIVLILIFHIARTTWLPYIRIRMIDEPSLVYLKNYINNFRIGVDVFVFLSPIGLFYSIQKHSLKTFYVNRIKRVFIPSMIILIPYFFWLEFFLRSDEFLYSQHFFITNFSRTMHRGLLFLGDITTVNYWIGSVPYSFWYVSFVFIIYAVYPFLYKLDIKTNRIFTYVMFALSIGLYLYINIAPASYTRTIETFLSRLPVFFLGILLSKLFTEKHEIPQWVLSVMLVLWGLTLWQLILWGSDGFFRMLGSLFAVLSVFLFAAIMKAGGEIMYIINLPFLYIGKYSFEIYMMHLIIFNIINTIHLHIMSCWGFFDGSLWMLITLFISLPVCVLIRYLTEKTIDFIEIKIGGKTVASDN